MARIASAQAKLQAEYETLFLELHDGSFEARQRVLSGVIRYTEEGMGALRRSLAYKKHIADQHAATVAEVEAEKVEAKPSEA